MMTTAMEALLTVDEILEETHGTSVGSRVYQVPVTGVSIDSRTCSEGYLFVPLPGSQTDGHEFIEDALKRGARTVFIEESQWIRRKDDLKGVIEDHRANCIVVPHVLAAFQQIAAYYISRYTSLYRIGITGSSGKTTTKELVGAVLSGSYSVFTSTGNLNSDIGVSLSAFQVKKTHEIAVFEMGINRIGEMAELTEIVDPDLAVITTTGTAHVGMFGSRETIAREKKMIFSRFTSSGVGFIREDDPFADFLASHVTGEIRRFGPKSIESFSIQDERGLSGTDLLWQGTAFLLPLIGRYNVYNACAAIRVAEHFGVPREEVIDALRSAKPMFGRGEIKTGDITLICDYYNANPESMRESIDFVGSLEKGYRKIAVLGVMKELGDYTGEAHRVLGERLKSADFFKVCLFGDEMKDAYHAVRDALGERVFWTNDLDELSAEVAGFVSTGDLVLLKGSRAAELERVENQIKEHRKGKKSV